MSFPFSRIGILGLVIKTALSGAMLSSPGDSACVTGAIQQVAAILLGRVCVLMLTVSDGCFQRDFFPFTVSFSPTYALYASLERYSNSRHQAGSSASAVKEAVSFFSPLRLLLRSGIILYTPSLTTLPNDYARRRCCDMLFITSSLYVYICFQTF